MILCVCNAISDRQVRQLAESGVTTAEDVYRALDCVPQCGECIPFVQEALSRAARRSKGPGPAGKA